MDKRFAMKVFYKEIGEDVLVYPNKIQKRGSDVATYRVSAVGQRDALGMGENAETLEQVISCLVQGYKVRAKSDVYTKVSGSYSITNGRSVKGYWVAPELRGLLKSYDNLPQISDEEYERLSGVKLK